jgi:invasion protein IalB
MLKSLTLAAAALLVVSAIVPSASAQQSPAPAAPKAAASEPKAGKGEKVCRHRHPDGTRRAWVCKKEEPCCAWDEIKYVKCGSVLFNCL